MRVDNNINFGWKPETINLTYLNDADLVSAIRQVYGYQHTYIFSKKDIDFFSGVGSLYCPEAYELVKAIQMHGRIIFNVEIL